MGGEGLLQRAQLAVGRRQPLDRPHLRPVRLHGEEHAALDRLAVEVDGAGAAVAGVAADVRSGQLELVADEVDEQAPRIDVALVDVAVDLDRDRHARRRLHAHRPRSCACATARTRADAGEVAAVVGGGVDVRWRVEVRRLEGLADAVLITTRGGKQDGNSVDATERNSHRVAGQAGGRTCKTGSVASDRDRREAVGGVRGGGHRDREQELALADDGHVDTEEELLRGDGSLARLAADRHRRAERDEQRRQVIRRVVRADVAADRAAVAHLDVGDLRRHLGQDRPRDVDLGRAHDLGVGRHRAQLQRVAGDRDRAQLVEPVQVDEHVRRGCAGLHHVDERLAAGERPGSLVRAEQLNRLCHRGRTRIFDLAEKHVGTTPISP